MMPITVGNPTIGSLMLSMGRLPELTLATLVDLGLSDDGIGRYFNVSPCNDPFIAPGVWRRATTSAPGNSCGTPRAARVGSDRCEV